MRHFIVCKYYLLVSCSLVHERYSVMYLKEQEHKAVLWKNDKISMLSGNHYPALDECGILSDPIFVCYQIIITRTSDECGIIITLPRAESGLTSCSRHSGLRPSCRQHSVRPDSSLGRVMNIPHSSSFE